MANSVKSKLVVHSTNQSELDRLQKAIEDGCLLQTYLPIPDSMIPVPSMDSTNISVSEVIKRETLRNQNLFISGYKTISDFKDYRWGTKWDIYPNAKIERIDCWNLTAVIETAWDAPVPLFRYLSGLGMNIDALFIDEVPNFIGFYNTYEGSGYLKINAELEIPKSKKSSKDIHTRFKNEMNFDVYEYVESLKQSVPDMKELTELGYFK
jgi:hypothetical protein